MHLLHSPSPEVNVHLAGLGFFLPNRVFVVETFAMLTSQRQTLLSSDTSCAVGNRKDFFVLARSRRAPSARGRERGARSADRWQKHLLCDEQFQSHHVYMCRSLKFDIAGCLCCHTSTHTHTHTWLLTAFRLAPCDYIYAHAAMFAVIYLWRSAP